MEVPIVSCHKHKLQISNFEWKVEICGNRVGDWASTWNFYCISYSIAKDLNLVDIKSSSEL